MIVGVALVVDELRKGERLIMRYPPSMSSTSTSTTSGGGSVEGAGADSGEHQQQYQQKDPLAGFHDEYMRMR